MILLILLHISKSSFSSQPFSTILIKVVREQNIFVCSTKGSEIHFRSFTESLETLKNRLYYADTHSNLNNLSTPYIHDSYSSDSFNYFSDGSLFKQSKLEKTISVNKYLVIAIKIELYNFMFQISANCVPYKRKDYITLSKIAVVISLLISNLYLFKLLYTNNYVDLTEISDMIMLFSWVGWEITQLKHIAWQPNNFYFNEMISILNKFLERTTMTIFCIKLAYREIRFGIPWSIYFSIIMGFIQTLFAVIYHFVLDKYSVDISIYVLYTLFSVGVMFVSLSNCINKNVEEGELRWRPSIIMVVSSIFSVSCSLGLTKKGVRSDINLLCNKVFIILSMVGMGLLLIFSMNRKKKSNGPFAKSRVVKSK